MTTQHWEHLPAEMRERKQWLLAGPNDKGAMKIPLSATVDGTLLPGSSTNRATWLTFERVSELAAPLPMRLTTTSSGSGPTRSKSLASAPANAL
jgi:hypothetical protein